MPQLDYGDDDNFEHSSESYLRPLGRDTSYTASSSSQNTRMVGAEKAKSSDSSYNIGSLVEIEDDGEWQSGMVLFRKEDGSFDVKLSENGKIISSVDRYSLRHSAKELETDQADITTDIPVVVEKGRRRSRSSFGFSSHTQFMHEPFTAGTAHIRTL